MHAFWGQSPFSEGDAARIEERQNISKGRPISEGRQESNTIRRTSGGRGRDKERSLDRARRANGGGRLRESDGYGMKWAGSEP